MGRDPDREPPFFFAKWAETVVPTGATVAYPPRRPTSTTRPSRCGDRQGRSRHRRGRGPGPRLWLRSGAWT
ncbi:hypothetical protein ACRAWD_23115 [Caulobacter segnis]